MAYLTKKEFAEKCGMTTNSLATEIRRGRLHVREDGLFDDTLPINFVYYQKRLGKGLIRNVRSPLLQPLEKPIVKSKKRKATKKKPASKPKPKETVIDDEDDFEDSLEEIEDDEEESKDGIMGLMAAERQIKHFKANNERLRSQQLEMLLLKQSAKLIPTEPIIPVMFQYGQFLLTTMRNQQEALLTVIAHRYDITPEDLAAYRSEMLNSLNTAMREAADLAENNLEGVLSSFMENKKL